jgi:hypothetical protein
MSGLLVTRRVALFCVLTYAHASNTSSDTLSQWPGCSFRCSSIQVLTGRGNLFDRDEMSYPREDMDPEVRWDSGYAVKQTVSGSNIHRSETLLLQVIHIVPVIDHAMPRDEGYNIIFHVFLQLR